MKYIISRGRLIWGFGDKVTMEEFCLAPRVGLEPTTKRLTAAYSTIELSGNTGCRAWIRTRAKGSKVPRATTTQLGIASLPNRLTGAPETPGIYISFSIFSVAT